MTRTWHASTSIALLIRFTTGSEGRLPLAACLIIARRMGGKVGLICGSCWSGKYSTYETPANTPASLYLRLCRFDPGRRSWNGDRDRFLGFSEKIVRSVREINVNDDRQIDILAAYIGYLCVVTRFSPFTERETLCCENGVFDAGGLHDFTVPRSRASRKLCVWACARAHCVCVYV